MHSGVMEIKEISTIDGRRTELRGLILGAMQEQDQSGRIRDRLASVLHGMTLTLAGMYTGMT